MTSSNVRPINTVVDVVHPASGSARDLRAQRPASQISSLVGRRVLLFSNNKPNVGIFLDELELQLQGQGVHTGRLHKLSSAFPAPPDVLDKVKEYEFAINAVAD